MDPTDPVTLACAFVAVNALTFALFGFDKAQAEAGHWRIAEATLLGCAFIGGSAGAFLGRQVFRHKTRKQPFSAQLDAIALLHLIAAAAALGWLIA